MVDRSNAGSEAAEWKRARRDSRGSGSSLSRPRAGAVLIDADRVRYDDWYRALLYGKAYLEVRTRDVRLLQPDYGIDGCFEECAVDADGRHSSRNCVQRLQEVRRFHGADQD